MLKKLCLFQIIILTLRHKNKKLVSIMAKIERQKRIYRKRIPYGMQNFEDVIKEDCYFVDKTPFIENIEESNKYFFFIRPRRFGKSLTISMLENYYDINKKDQFESLFGKLYIGENPTPERNSYLILHLNFAMISAGLDNYKKGRHHGGAQAESRVDFGRNYRRTDGEDGRNPEDDSGLGG
jgi:hypothetical protein